MRHLLSLSIAVLSVTAVLAVPFAAAAVQSMTVAPGEQLATSCATSVSVQTVDAQHATVLCAAAPSSSTPTSPSPSSPSSGTTVNGVPLCDGQNGRPAHDPTKWHPLVVRNANGSVLCTYGHEHGMDPTSVDAVFGKLPLAQQISYPWATVSATGVPENGPDIKHRVYKWIVAPSLACSLNNSPDGSSKMVTAFREELHADGSLGAAIRFHSFWGQYRLTDCATGDTGFLSIGGHMDYADLNLGPNHTHDPLPTDPTAGCLLNGDSRQEGLLGSTEQSQSVWYGINGRSTIKGVSPVCDDWNDSGAPHVGVGLNSTTSNFGPIDPKNPSAVLFYPDTSVHNGTTIRTDALTVSVYGFPTDALGHVNFTGHVNRHGVVVPEVSGKAEDQDYIPLVIRNAKPKMYGSNGAIPGAGSLQHQPVAYSGDVPGPQGQPGYYVQKPSQ